MQKGQPETEHTYRVMDFHETTAPSGHVGCLAGGRSVLSRSGPWAVSSVRSSLSSALSSLQAALFSLSPLLWCGGTSFCPFSLYPRFAGACLQSPMLGCPPQERSVGHASAAAGSYFSGSQCGLLLSSHPLHLLTPLRPDLPGLAEVALDDSAFPTPYALFRNS